MNDVVFNTLKEKDFIVKNFLIRVAKELNLSLNEFLLLTYFYNQEKPELDIAQINKSIGLSEMEIMEAFSKLNGINLIDVKVSKDDMGVRKEIISLDNIIKQVTTDITNNIKNREDEDIYSTFEKEFARPLSHMEYEIINEWIESNISSELIIEALRVAVYNGSTTLRYISAVLNDWKKKGYKTKSDLSTGMKNENLDNTLFDILDSDWMNEN